MQSPAMAQHGPELLIASFDGSIGAPQSANGLTLLGRDLDGEATVGFFAVDDDDGGRQSRHFGAPQPHCPIRLAAYVWTMVLRSHDPPDLFPPYANHTHAVEVAAGARLLFISGLNGFEVDGKTMPSQFEAQAELIWSHLEAVLASAEMTVDDLVSLRFYLAEPAHDPSNVAVLKRRLGDHHAARTVVCAGLLEPGWLIEVEAVAAARPVGP